ncbi:hypothetical protein RAA17_12865 [Komagataeibacter rhaeticus]|nr:hypothetical protein [Komagataeibacter rhaeticus]
MSAIDLSIICLYCLALPGIAYALSGRQDPVSAYLGGGMTCHGGSSACPLWRPKPRP